MLRQLRFGRGLDNRRLKATGYRYRYTTRETVLRLGEHQRLEPILRGARRSPTATSARSRSSCATAPACGRRPPAARPSRATPRRPPARRGHPAPRGLRRPRGRARSSPLLPSLDAEACGRCTSTRPPPARGTVLAAIERLQPWEAGALTSYTCGTAVRYWTPEVRSRTLIITATLGVASPPAAPRVSRLRPRPRGRDRQGRERRRDHARRPDAAQAKAKLDRLIIQPLERPIVVHHDRSTWTLGAREARIAVDIDAIVDDALARSREGNILARTCAQRHAASSSTPTSSRRSRTPTAPSSGMLDKIRRAVDRKPRRRDGEALRAAGVRRPTAAPASPSRQRAAPPDQAAIVARRPTARFSRRARTKSGRRSPTSDLAATERGTAIVVNRSAFKLTLYKELKPAKTYSIAVGQVGLETPAGLYHIQNKAVNPAWNVPNSDWAG